ncbi:hypothetical protein D9M68_812070 [compost metagenome]
MDQGQVDVVGAQLLQAVAQAVDQLALGVVVHPDLGGEEQLGTGDAAFGDGLADVGLVAVDLRGVDGAIAQLQCVTYRIDEGLAGQAEGTEAEGRDEGDGRHGCTPEG